MGNYLGYDHPTGQKGFIPNSDYLKRESKNGKYTSITITKMMNNADEILYIYEKASKIDGIISL